MCVGVFCFFFLQTDTTELKPVFGSSIYKMDQSSLKTTVSSRCKEKQWYKALENTCSYPTIWSYPIYLEVLKFQSLHG